MSDYSPLKCGVIWSGILAVAVAFMLPLTIMVNHYNDTERDRANVCTEHGGTYVETVCTWSTER